MEIYKTNSIRYPKYGIDKEHNSTLVELSSYDGQGFKVGTAGFVPTGLSVDELKLWLEKALKATIELKNLMVKDGIYSERIIEGDKVMTIAGQVKAHHIDINECEKVKSYSALVAECEEIAIDVTQNWDHESTEYTFADNSVLIWCNSDISVYASKD
jgi:hypothetical protein